MLLDDDFRIKITDFGTGKILETPSKFNRINASMTYILHYAADKAETWVGTAQYIAPELIEAKETSRRFVFHSLWSRGLTSSVAPTFGLLVV